MDKKLAGWKANNLSLAGRVTLASSVLNVIPSFVMQTAFLPVHVCEAIDKRIRDFVWGSVQGSRKIHNINWDTVCKPKSLGGLGLRSARDLNQAFLMKIVWGLVSRPSELWAKVLFSKYLKQTGNGYTLARKKGFSAVWRGVLKAWPLVINDIHWSIRDGRNTHFWTDRWVDSGVVLADHALDIRRVESSLLVSEVYSKPGVWNVDFLLHVLPYNIVMQVVGMTPPSNTLGGDSIVWGLEPDGAFSVRSAYLMITDNAATPSDLVWRHIWRWNGPNKIKHFLWLATHKKLLTNEERGRRHLTNQVLCHCCSIHTESISHVIYECDFAMQVWRLALPQAISVRNAYRDFDSWWRAMLNNKDYSTQSWVIRIEHVYREANCGADYLANLGHSCNFGLHLLSHPDSTLAQWLRYDLVGGALPKAILI
ncbi:Putative ribonuclease H protein At1g65750 [Linum perenne]